jgi:hypothetical protein
MGVPLAVISLKRVDLPPIERGGKMKDQRIPVQSLDPNDDEVMGQWAGQLGVTVATLREAVAAIGTDVDKIKGWLATRPGGESAAAS